MKKVYSSVQTITTSLLDKQLSNQKIQLNLVTNQFSSADDLSKRKESQDLYSISRVCKNRLSVKGLDKCDELLWSLGLEKKRLVERNICRLKGLD